MTTRALQNTRFESGAYALIAGFLDEVGYRAITATERGSSNEVR